MLSTIVVVIAFVQLQVMVSGLSTRPNETDGQLNEQKSNSNRNGPSSTTKIAGDFLDCNKCFGHGQQENPDPRCRFGCGRVMTFPPTEEKDEFIDESYNGPTEFSSTMETYTESLQFAVKTKLVTREPVKSQSSFLSELKSWKGMLGLGILLIASIVIIIYVVYQKKIKTPQTKLATFNWAKSTDTIATLA